MRWFSYVGVCKAQEAQSFSLACKPRTNRCRPAVGPEIRPWGPSLDSVSFCVDSLSLLHFAPISQCIANNGPGLRANTVQPRFGVMYRKVSHDPTEEIPCKQAASLSTNESLLLQRLRMKFDKPAMSSGCIWQSQTWIRSAYITCRFTIGLQRRRGPLHFVLCTSAACSVMLTLYTRSHADSFGRFKIADLHCEACSTSERVLRAAVKLSFKE